MQILGSELRKWKKRNCSNSYLEGAWISENGKQQIQCKIVDNNVFECTWPNHLVENFQIESEIIRGIKNPQICGFPSKDGIIKWTSGNQWTKEGNNYCMMYMNIWNILGMLYIPYDMQQQIRLKF